MREEIMSLGEFKIEDLYSGKAVATLHIKYNGLKSIVTLRLLNNEKVPDCYIIEPVWKIELRTEKGIKGKKYESIEELMRDCYDKLKGQDMMPIAMVVSNVVKKQVYPFIENYTKNDILDMNDKIDFDYGVKIIKSCNILAVPKLFAKNNLSKDAISYAQVLEQYYIWDLNTTAWVVIFEIPSVVYFTFQEVLRGLINHNIEYMRKNNLNDNVIYYLFVDNTQKELIDEIEW